MPEQAPAVSVFAVDVKASDCGAPAWMVCACVPGVGSPVPVAVIVWLPAPVATKENVAVVAPEGTVTEVTAGPLHPAPA